MKNWLAPIAVLGLSGVGLVVASKRGREKVRSFLEGFGRSGDPLSEVGKFFDDQLDAIQHALDRLAESLEEQNT